MEDRSIEISKMGPSDLALISYGETLESACIALFDSLEHGAILFRLDSDQIQLRLKHAATSVIKIRGSQDAMQRLIAGAIAYVSLAKPAITNDVTRMIPDDMLDFPESKYIHQRMHKIISILTTYGRLDDFNRYATYSGEENVVLVDLQRRHELHSVVFQ